MAGTVPSSLAFSHSANPIVDEYHGVSIPDPYRRLEQLESPETRCWIEEQRTTVATFFEQQPSYEAVRRRLAELWQYPKYSVPFKHGRWRFFWGQDLAMQEDFQPQAVLYRQEALEGDFQVVLDPSSLSKDGSARRLKVTSRSSLIRVALAKMVQPLLPRIPSALMGRCSPTHFHAGEATGKKSGCFTWTAARKRSRRFIGASFPVLPGHLTMLAFSTTVTLPRVKPLTIERCMATIMCVFTGWARHSLPTSSSSHQQPVRSYALQ